MCSLWLLRVPVLAMSSSTLSTKERIEDAIRVLHKGFAWTVFHPSTFTEISDEESVICALEELAQEGRLVSHARMFDLLSEDDEPFFGGTTAECLQEINDKPWLKLCNVDLVVHYRLSASYVE